MTSWLEFPSILRCGLLFFLLAFSWLLHQLSCPAGPRFSPHEPGQRIFAAQDCTILRRLPAASRENDQGLRAAATRRAAWRQVQHGKQEGAAGSQEKNDGKALKFLWGLQARGWGRRHQNAGKSPVLSSLSWKETKWACLFCRSVQSAWRRPMMKSSQPKEPTRSWRSPITRLWRVRRRPKKGSVQWSSRPSLGSTSRKSRSVSFASCLKTSKPRMFGIQQKLNRWVVSFLFIFFFFFFLRREVEHFSCDSPLSLTSEREREWAFGASWRKDSSPSLLFSTKCARPSMWAPFYLFIDLLLFIFYLIHFFLLDYLNLSFLSPTDGSGEHQIQG